MAIEHGIDLFEENIELDAKQYVLGLSMYLDAGLIAIVPTEWAIKEGMFEAR